MSDTLQVCMLGGFSLSLGDNTIDDSNNRMRKVWLLLAYLIYTRSSRVTQDSLLSLIQSPGSDLDDPSGRLKALFYRVRSMLDALGDRAGHQLIVHKSGNYQWNNEIPVQLDVENFDKLCSSAFMETEDARLSLLLQALPLYRGDFLPKLSVEAWVMPIHAYYHQRYLDAANEALRLLLTRNRFAEASELCAKAIKIEPYNEELYQHKMRCQIAAGDRNGAVCTYETMSELLFDAFGVMPSDDSRKLYRDASQESESQTIPSAEVRDQLQEDIRSKGAMYCEYDFFKFLYQVQARSIARTGDVIHIALLTVHSADKKPLARRSLDRAMDNLQTLVISSLRQGDVVTRCSASQLIVMLPQANYENSCAVCQRIIKAFCRQFPHSPAEIHSSIHPLEPARPETQR